MHSDDAHFRTHFEQSADRLADRSFDHARPAYELGRTGAARDDWRERDFEAVEADLQKGWTDENRLRYGDWSTVRGFAREGWTRGRATPGTSSDEGATLSSEAAGGGGSWGEHLEGQTAGHVDPAVGANLGGSPSHQRPSFADPVAALADDVAGAVDPDGRVEMMADRGRDPVLEQAPEHLPDDARA